MTDTPNFSNMLPQEIVDSKEPWSEVTLANGDRLQFRAQVTAVFKFEGVWEENGVPKYAILFAPQSWSTLAKPENMRPNEPTPFKPKIV